MSSTPSDSIRIACRASIDSLRHHLAVSDSIQEILRLKLKYADQLTDAMKVTNEHLYYWWTPMGTFIAALGVLFTIGGIVAGYLAYRQSKESRIAI